MRLIRWFWWGSFRGFESCGVLGGWGGTAEEGEVGEGGMAGGEGGRDYDIILRIFVTNVMLSYVYVM